MYVHTCPQELKTWSLKRENLSLTAPDVRGMEMKCVGSSLNLLDQATISTRLFAWAITDAVGPSITTWNTAENRLKLCSGSCIQRAIGAVHIMCREKFFLAVVERGLKQTTWPRLCCSLLARKFKSTYVGYI